MKGCTDTNELNVMGDTEEMNEMNKIKKTMNEEGVHVRETASLYLLAYDKAITGDFTQFQEESNGIVLEKGTNRIVCACNKKFVDIVDDEKMVDIVEVDMDIASVEYCEEGTMIRLYNYEGVWYTATSRCIDARESIWSSKKSFDELFWEVFDKSLLEAMDVSYTYMFILLHTDNVIVIKHKKNELVYVSRVNNETLKEDFEYCIEHENIRRPQKLLNFDIKKLNTYYDQTKRGVLIRTDKKVYKIDFEMYNNIKLIRGNVPQLTMRYLELLPYPESLIQLEHYYPEQHFLFAVIKHQLANLVKNIYKLYRESHVKHTVLVGEGHEFYRTLKQLHAQYKTSGNFITVLDVENKVKNLDKYILKKFLKWY